MIKWYSTSCIVIDRSTTYDSCPYLKITKTRLSFNKAFVDLLDMRKISRFNIGYDDIKKCLIFEPCKSPEGRKVIVKPTRVSAYIDYASSICFYEWVIKKCKRGIYRVEVNNAKRTIECYFVK